MRTIFVLFISILIFATNSIAGGKFELTVAPSFFKTFGSTDYTLDLTFPIELTNGGTLYENIKSELIFPLDAVMAGFQFTLAPGVQSTLPLSLKASIYTNINAPGSKMEDSDWHRLPPFFDEWFSYTESDVKMKSGIVDVELRYNFLSKPKVNLYLLGGLRYQHIRQDIQNYKGWQKPFDADSLTYGDRVYFSADVKALLYKIDYLMPKIGLALITDRAGKISVDASAAVSRVSFEDYDDHILRNKLSTSDGDGFGILANADLRYQLKELARGSRPFVEFTIALVHISADGNQTQKWYGPDGYYDPDTDEWVGAVEGDIITGVPHEIRSMQFSAGFRFGVRF